MTRSLALFLTAASFASVHGAVLGIGSRHRQRQREEDVGRVTFATACGAATFGVSSRLQSTYQPGRMAYFKTTRPMFSPTQRISLGLAAVAVGLVLDESLGVVRGDNALSKALRSSSRTVLRVTDCVRNRFSEDRARREREAQREWGREHTKAARIYTPRQ